MRQSKYSGRFIQEFSDKQFIQSVRSRTISTAKDVADDLGCNTRIARERLDVLVERGEIEMKLAGSTKTYFVTNF